LKKKNNVTIYDVARHSGLSPKTVSRVINGSDNVAQPTREKVEKSIQYLNYTPNLVARGLRAEKSKSLGIVTLNAFHPVPIQAMEHEASQLDYTLAFYSINPHDEENFIKKFNTIRAQMIDGIAVITPHSFISYEQIKAHTNGIPLVLLNSHVNAEIPSVIYDQAYGIRCVTEHLIELGHRNICEIAGTIKTRIDAEVRHHAFLETMQKHHLPDPVTIEGDFSSQAGYDATGQLLDNEIEFTALVCVNDETALGAIQRLRHEGLRVPEDVSVVGFDDSSYSRFLYTPLTTIRQDFNRLGSTAIKYLGELLEHKSTTVAQRILKPEFIIRESTGHPPA